MKIKCHFLLIIFCSYFSLSLIHCCASQGPVPCSKFKENYNRFYQETQKHYTFCQDHADCFLIPGVSACFNCLNNNGKQSVIENTKKWLSSGQSQGCFPVASCARASCHCVSSKCQLKIE